MFDPKLVTARYVNGRFVIDDANVFTIDENDIKFLKFDDYRFMNHGCFSSNALDHFSKELTAKRDQMALDLAKDEAKESERISMDYAFAGVFSREYKRRIAEMSELYEIRYASICNMISIERRAIKAELKRRLDVYQAVIASAKEDKRNEILRRIS